MKYEKYHCKYSYFGCCKACSWVLYFCLPHNPQYLDKLYSFITRIPTANGAHLWIGGDFNLGDINWEKETVNEYATNGTQCNQLLTITKDTFLDQVVQEPTRVTETQH